MINKILWDCHMHSSFSADSETPMEKMIEKSILLGLSGICFTEHYDPDYPVTPDHASFPLDFQSYRNTFSLLKESFSEQISLNFGIELGLQPHLKDQFHTLVTEYPFDFVIGSSHVVHRKDPYYPSYYAQRSEDESYREYFESIAENVHIFSDIDVYGHLDYVVRYGPNQNKYYSYSKYEDIIDEILKILVEKGIGMEVNTGGFHYGLGQPNPCTDIIKRYREFGGEIITIGADAHKPEFIGYDFNKAAAILQDCGFSYYTVFFNRKPHFLPLQK